MNKDKELERALNFHRAGQKNEASAIYDSILKHDPCHSDSWHLKGLLLYDEGRLDEAEAMIKKAIELLSDSALYHSNLGLVLSEKNNMEESLASYIKAHELDPDSHEACYRTALSLHNLGRSSEALKYYEKTLALKYDHAETWNNIGNIAVENLKVDDAWIFYSKAVEINPHYSEAYNNMGCLLLKLNRCEEAEVCFNKAISEMPDFYEAYVNLGNTYKKKEMFDLARECYEKALEIKPYYNEALYGLADNFRFQKDDKKALELFLKIDENWHMYSNAVSGIISVTSHACDWENYDFYRKKLRTLTLEALEKGDEIGDSPFLCLGRYEDDGYAAKVTAAWSRKIEKDVIKLGVHFDHELKRNKEKQIVLGYYSNNVKNHPNAHLVQGLFSRHDRNRFRVHVYSYGEDDNSSYRKKIEKEADLFRDISEVFYVDAAKKMYEDGVDILIDLTGYTLGSVMDLPALRPAPVQVRYLGFPGSMQAGFFDYIITDRIMTPPEDQNAYTEKFVYMPDCYQVNDRDQKASYENFTRKDFNLPEKGFVFCSFNTSYKIEKVMFNVWLDILEEVPGSVLWLLRENDMMKQNLKEHARKRGFDDSRLVFSDKISKDRHFARLKLADLALDTRLVSGHITTSDALWAGVPVITKKGSYFISRAPASILTNIGLPDLVTESLDEYKKLAVSLATDEEKLKEIKNRLKSNIMTAPLFDTDLFVKNFEKGLVAMWEIFRSGKSPEQIVI